MSKKTILPLIMALLLFNCTEIKVESNNPVSIEKEWLKYEIGQTWTYKRMFINEGAGSLMDVPDTLFGYSEFEVTKDTLFENTTWLIIEGMDYECDEDSIQEFDTRYAITFTDTSLRVHQFKSDNLGFSWGPFKRTAYSESITKSDFSGIRNLSTKMLMKKKASSKYDTTIFSDLYIPLVFNIDPGYAWYIRSADDPNGNTPIEKVYMGRENVTVPAGMFNSYKFELLSGKALGVPGIRIFSWYSNVSLVKQLMDLGTMTIDNDEGQFAGTVHTWDIFEYLGPGKIDKALLIPWGQKR